MADAKAYDLYPTVIIVDKTNLCEKCNLFFKIPSDLNLHISLKHELKTHIVVHTGEKNKFEGKTNFNCKQCDFYFSEAFELKEHVYTKNHFIRHMQIHSKERGFHCEDCNFSSTSSAKFNEHNRAHKGDSKGCILFAKVLDCIL